MKEGLKAFGNGFMHGMVGTVTAFIGVLIAIGGILTVVSGVFPTIDYRKPKR